MFVERLRGLRQGTLRGPNFVGPAACPLAPPAQGGILSGIDRFSK